MACLDWKSLVVKYYSLTHTHTKKDRLLNWFACGNVFIIFLLIWQNKFVAMASKMSCIWKHCSHTNIFCSQSHGGGGGGGGRKNKNGPNCRLSPSNAPPPSGKVPVQVGSYTYLHIWVLTLTATSAGVYMLKLCAPGNRSVSTFCSDSEHLALVQTYCCCSTMLSLKVRLDMA